MEYRSVADLNADVRRLAWELPAEVDRIVGVDHGGVVAADLLRQTTGLPVMELGDVDWTVGGSTGGRNAGRSGDDGSAAGTKETVLALADWAGPTTDLRGRVEGTVPCSDLRVGAVYAAPYARDRLDHWIDVVDAPCAFEWTALRPDRLGNACMDIDGVLCRDPTPEENDDGPNYREFLETVDPQYVPREEVGWLVTSRLEQYREETEAWLDRHGVEYGELVMMDLPSKAARDERGDHAAYKTRVYEGTGADLFVESSVSQAVAIARRTGKPVYCFDRNRMVPPGEAAAEFGHDPYLVRLVRDPASFLRAAGRHVATKATRAVARTATEGGSR